MWGICAASGSKMAWALFNGFAFTRYDGVGELGNHMGRLKVNFGQPDGQD